jgi:methylglutamate dehydrogenase subunit B
MSFLLSCPHCGRRDVGEFICAGEVTERPRTLPTPRELASYLYFRHNVAGTQREWWYHRDGCELWFLAERDTRTNEVRKTERPAPESAGATGPEQPAVAEPPAV